MITRKEYMDGTFTHEEYYSQFVNDTIKDLVINRIGLYRIKKSTDPYFNDIPLREWDSLEPIIRNSFSIVLSLSDCVCIAKQAARMIKESSTDKD